jgi:hypothetical protein
MITFYVPERGAYHLIQAIEDYLNSYTPSSEKDFDNIASLIFILQDLKAKTP